MSTTHSPDGSRLVTLPHNTVHSLIDGQGTLIACLAAKVWITQDGDERDIVLTAGETFRIDRPGLTLINGFGRATIAVLPPEPLVLAA